MFIAQLHSGYDYDLLGIDDRLRLPIIGAVICDESELDKLMPHIISYEPDEEIELSYVKPSLIPVQIVPKSNGVQAFVKRVGADRSSQSLGKALSDRTDINLFVVDSGISKRAEINLVGGYNSSGGDVNAYHDNNGHGTHVAGIAGATFGVAPGVRLWAMKVTSDNGIGSLMTILKALDWILKGKDKVWKGYGIVNVSMSGGLNKYVDQAVEKLCKAGVIVCVAAGNFGIDASFSSPARVSDAITVGATCDKNYSSFADYSNHGSSIDILAPGSNIYSLYRSGYAILSGTSMSCPVVSATVALMLSSGRDIPKGEQLVKEVKASLIRFSSLSSSLNYDKTMTNNPRITLTEKAKRSGTTNVSVKAGCF